MLALLVHIFSDILRVDSFERDMTFNMDCNFRCVTCTHGFNVKTQREHITGNNSERNSFENEINQMSENEQQLRNNSSGTSIRISKFQERFRKEAEVKKTEIEHYFEQLTKKLNREKKSAFEKIEQWHNEKGRDLLNLESSFGYYIQLESRDNGLFESQLRDMHHTLIGSFAKILTSGLKLRFKNSFEEPLVCVSSRQRWPYNHVENEMEKLAESAEYYSQIFISDHRLIITQADDFDSIIRSVDLNEITNAPIEILKKNHGKFDKFNFMSVKPNSDSFILTFEGPNGRFLCGDLSCSPHNCESPVNITALKKAFKTKDDKILLWIDGEVTLLEAGTQQTIWTLEINDINNVLLGDQETFITQESYQIIIRSLTNGDVIESISVFDGEDEVDEENREPIIDIACIPFKIFVCFERCIKIFSTEGSEIGKISLNYVARQIAVSYSIFDQAIYVLSEDRKIYEISLN